MERATRSGKLLVVEDDDIVRSVLGRLFSPPHEVAELTHRSEGLPEASAPRPRGTEWVRLLAMGFVRDAHFYRRVPTDVSEATKSGGLVSIFAFVTIVWLVLAQFNESYSTKRTTQLKLDRN